MKETHEVQEIWPDFSGLGSIPWNGIGSDLLQYESHSRLFLCYRLAIPSDLWLQDRSKCGQPDACAQLPLWLRWGEPHQGVDSERRQISLCLERRLRGNLADCVPERHVSERLGG